jgi:hypothetical protein
MNWAIRSDIPVFYRAKRGKSIQAAPLQSKESRASGDSVHNIRGRKRDKRVVPPASSVSFGSPGVAAGVCLHFETETGSLHAVTTRAEGEPVYRRHDLRRLFAEPEASNTLGLTLLGLRADRLHAVASSGFGPQPIDVLVLSGAVPWGTTPFNKVVELLQPRLILGLSLEGLGLAEESGWISAWQFEGAARDIGSGPSLSLYYEPEVLRLVMKLGRPEDFAPAHDVRLEKEARIQTVLEKRLRPRVERWLSDRWGKETGIKDPRAIRQRVDAAVERALPLTTNYLSFYECRPDSTFEQRADLDLALLEGLEERIRDDVDLAMTRFRVEWGELRSLAEAVRARPRPHL